ncbi:MAG: hypothetical protein AAB383_04650 [Patescibacteria group bacterium]
MTWVKWFALAFVAGFLLPRTYGPSLSASLLGPTSSTFDGMDMTDAITEYHLRANQTVDQFLDVLLDPDLSELVVSYPPDDSECTGNVSTYCLAVSLNNNLEDFAIYLQKNQTSFSDSLFEDDAALSLQDALDTAAHQRSTVDEQVALAEDSIDLTLAVYNQVQLVYPVHKEMLALIQNLDDYRGNLSKIRDVLEEYPSKFNGASTAQCK